MSKNKLTTSELVEELAERLDLSNRQCKRMLDELIDLIGEQLTSSPDSRVSLHGFGSFEIQQHRGRRGVDPRDHEKEIDIPARSVPKFRAGKTLKRKVREAFDKKS